MVLYAHVSFLIANSAGGVESNVTGAELKTKKIFY